MRAVIIFRIKAQSLDWETWTTAEHSDWLWRYEESCCRSPSNTQNVREKKISCCSVRNNKQLTEMNAHLKKCRHPFFHNIWVIEMLSAARLPWRCLSCLPLLRPWMAGFTSTWRTTWWRCVTLSWKPLKRHTTPSSSCWTNPPEWVRHGESRRRVSLRSHRRINGMLII